MFLPGSGFQISLDTDPVPGSGSYGRGLCLDPNPFFLPVSGSESGLEQIMDPDSVKIRPDPKHYMQVI